MDKLIRTKGIEVEAPDGLPEPQDGFNVEIVNELNLQERGVTTLIWAAGYADYQWPL